MSNSHVELVGTGGIAGPVCCFEKRFDALDLLSGVVECEYSKGTCEGLVL